MSVIFQGPEGPQSDRKIYREELRLAELAEPLDFQSVWAVEHHFTDYTMSPDVLQFLSYMAGRTKNVKLGSMVVVLPWHTAPMRVAEEVSLIDHLSDGRFIFGIGRGLGRVEFEGFGVNQEDSREIFVEYARMILEGLESGHCEADGKFIKQKRRDIRPAPFKTFRGRTYAAAVSPESSQIMARLGVGLLIVPQKPWDQVVTELKSYREIYREVNGAEPPPPVVAGWVMVDEDAGRAAEDANRYIGNYYRSVIDHYELAGSHLVNMKGYESYGKMQAMMQSSEAQSEASKFFVGLHPWGTPDQVVEKIAAIREMTGAEGFVSVFSYGGMPAEKAEANMRLFADKVMPRLKAMGMSGDKLAAVAAD
jgi:alkanesulfonate monooxygenase SsuD/methylene tetrahydromethanopterin reductase-like flavin-dependent oxidoreductase (luciferase family)